MLGCKLIVEDYDYGHVLQHLLSVRHDYRPHERLAR